MPNHGRFETSVGLQDAGRVNVLPRSVFTQVHLATLDGTPVAVKVQRPTLRQLFDTDFASVRLVAR